jgi:hypothetical protein
MATWRRTGKVDEARATRATREEIVVADHMDQMEEADMREDQRGLLRCSATPRKDIGG